MTVSLILATSVKVEVMMLVLIAFLTLLHLRFWLLVSLQNAHRVNQKGLLKRSNVRSSNYTLI